MAQQQRRELTPAELSGKEGALRRTFEVRAANAEDRTVELSFSSELEYQRWFGIEVLGHADGEVELDRMQTGAALLVNHDWDDQVGVVESVRIDADRVGRAVVRFGRSARAQEIFQDVQDGIRRLVSVGYRVLDAKLVETRGELDVYRVTRWQPYEISLVSVPADPTVGVGRQLEIPQEETHDAPAETGTVSNSTVPAEDKRTMSDITVPATPATNPAAERQAGADAERARVRAIVDLGEKLGIADLARDFVGNGQSVEAFQSAALERMHQRNSKPLGERIPSADIGLTDKEARDFSLMRAIRALLPNASKEDREAAAFEFDCSRAAEKQYGKDAQGILIPDDVLARAFNAGGAANTPAGAATGSEIVATDLLAGSFIDMLRNRTSIMRLGTTMGGLVGNVEIPKQTGGATAYWVAEGADATEGSPTLGQIGLSPKTVAAYTDITRRLMMQATPAAEGIVRRDLLAAMGLAIDTAGYYGTGATNQPRGLKNYAGINAVDFAAANPTFAELVAMETAIAQDNADVNSMGYVFNATMRGHFKTTPKMTTGTADQGLIWEPGGTVNGYRTEVTNQIANGDIFFGNFSDLVIGLWGGLDLTVDPYSLSKSGGTRIVVFQDVDFVLRRVESICYGVMVP